MSTSVHRSRGVGVTPQRGPSFPRVGGTSGGGSESGKDSSRKKSKHPYFVVRTGPRNKKEHFLSYRLTKPKVRRPRVLSSSFVLSHRGHFLMKCGTSTLSTLVFLLSNLLSPRGGPSVPGGPLHTVMTSINPNSVDLLYDDHRSPMSGFYDDL